jgi:hypothetical protein
MYIHSVCSCCGAITATGFSWMQQTHVQADCDSRACSREEWHAGAEQVAVAVLSPPDIKDAQQAPRNHGPQRGATVAVFTNREEAVAWLLS